jgi:filamentous hemagglutinin family protein
MRLGNKTIKLIQVSWLLLSNLLALPLSAEIILDGTLGLATELPGPQYQITADLGQQYGSNLFHSFNAFNINNGEIATFSGPNQINHIISRVTGNHPSTINGILRSTIPNADVYLLNPAGILFGEQARLDIQGSFYASTADYLQFTAGQFNAKYPTNSVLTIAPPIAFGFLDVPTNLEIQGSQLFVPALTNLSLIGGDLKLAAAKLMAPGGQINLFSVASGGEVVVPKMQPDNLNLSISAPQQGRIQLLQSRINLDGPGGGGLTIQGDELTMQDSSIQAKTLAQQDGNNFTLNLAKSIHISGSAVALSNSTQGKGHAGLITIATPYLEIDSGNIETSSSGEGQAGDINIKTNQLVMKNGGNIYSDSFGQGNGGHLNIVATESASIVDQRYFQQVEPADFSTGISSAAVAQGQGGRITLQTQHLNLVGGTITSNTHNEGQAGQIIIQADNIDIQAGGLISATALSQSTGKGGSIEIRVKDTLQMAGFRPGWIITSTDHFENLPTAISALTLGKGTAGNILLTAKNIVIADQATIAAATGTQGAAGHVVITAENLSLTSGGLITNSSGGILGDQVFQGGGPSGTITITVSGNVVASGQSKLNSSGILSNTIASGQGGNIILQANYLTLANNAAILANSSGKGNAGKITLQANTITLANGAKISSSAEQSTGGHIIIVTPGLLYLQAGKITTSVGSGEGNGGNITIEKPILVVLDKAQLVAQADAGQGGNIFIHSDHWVASQDSLVSSSSKLGIDGQVFITSPTMDVGSRLVILSTELLEVADQLNKSCANQTGANNKHNRFIVTMLAGAPPSPSDWQSDHLSEQAFPFSKTMSPDKMADQPVSGPALPFSKTGASAKIAAPPVVIISCNHLETTIIPEQLF